MTHDPGRNLAYDNNIAQSNFFFDAMGNFWRIGEITLTVVSKDFTRDLKAGLEIRENAVTSTLVVRETVVC